MKKNNMLRLASVLLVAVLLSTCAVSGVFAYYMSTDSTDDDARVAKWGVVINYDDVDMFQTNYNDTVVSSETDVDVVAPGTAGALTGMTITGTPEVDVDVTYDAELTLTGWTLENGDFYCPIVITVNDDDFTINYDYVGEGNALIDFQNRVNAAIEAKAATYQANTNLADAAVDVANDVVVTWEWAFGEDTDPEIATIIANDTYLGDQAAAGNASTIKLALTTTITQID